MFLEFYPLSFFSWDIIDISSFLRTYIFQSIDIFCYITITNVCKEYPVAPKKSESIVVWGMYCLILASRTNIVGSFWSGQTDVIWKCNINICFNGDQWKIILICSRIKILQSKLLRKMYYSVHNYLSSRWKTIFLNNFI